MTEERKYAGFWVRVAAVLLDTFIIGVPLTILIMFIGMPQWLYFLAMLLYFVIMNASKWQATMGKRIVGIYIMKTDGTRLSYLRSLGRYLSYIISGLPLYIGFMMAGWTKEKRALHDMIASTYVVYGKK